jgi:hypothetical protein
VGRPPDLVRGIDGLSGERHEGFTDPIAGHFDGVLLRLPLVSGNRMEEDMDEFMDQGRMDVPVLLPQRIRRGQTDLCEPVIKVHLDVADGLHLMGPPPVHLDLPVGQPEDLLPMGREVPGFLNRLDGEGGLVNRDSGCLARSLSPP